MDDLAGTLKRNAFVIAALALPILVVSAFVLARVLPALTVEDPRYDLVYSVMEPYSSTPRTTTCEITAVDGRVRARWSKVEQPVYSQSVRVYRLDGATGVAAELPVPEPLDFEGPTGQQDFFLAGLEGVRIETSRTAPDGYEFETSYRGGGGLFGELFGGGRRGARSRISRSGRVIGLPSADQGGYGYESVTFIGWAIPREDGG